MLLFVLYVLIVLVGVIIGNVLECMVCILFIIFLIVLLCMCKFIKNVFICLGVVLLDIKNWNVVFELFVDKVLLEVMWLRVCLIFIEMFYVIN